MNTHPVNQDDVCYVESLCHKYELEVFKLRSVGVKGKELEPSKRVLQGYMILLTELKAGRAYLFNKGDNR